MATETISEKRRKFERSGPVAVRATAIGILLDCDSAEAAPEIVDGVATITIRGPLVQYAGGWWDSYESILARATKAARSDAKTVILKIHSPGGDVFGTFETARAIRALFETAGKESIAYIEGEACSAAYALAIACGKVVLTSTSLIGSVGVINTLVSCARNDAANGLDVVLVTSGARKADGNAHAPITDGAISANQEMVDDLAAEFFRWVSEARGGLDASAREAGVFVGERAITLGLADEIDTESNLRANLARGNTIAEAKTVPTATAAQSRGLNMATPENKAQAAAPKASSYEEAIAAVAKAAEEGDERARKALKHLARAADEGEDKDEGDGAKDGEKKESKKAESSDNDKGDEKKDDDKKDAKAVSAAAPSAAATVSLDAEIRASLIASRPDLANDAKLQEKFQKASIADLKAAVETMPKAAFTPPAQPVAGTRGADANTRMVPSGQRDRLAEAMGLSKASGPRVTRANGITVFGGSSAQIELILGQHETGQSTGQGSK